MLSLRRLRLLPVLTLLAAALAGRADETEGGSWTVTPSYASHYMFRGVQLAGASLQPTLEYARGNFAGGLWGSCPLTNEHTGPTNWELDFYGATTLPLVADQLDLALGGTVYTYPNAHRSDGVYPVSVEPSAALNWTVKGVRMTPKLYYDFMLKSPTAEVSIAFAVPLASLGTELDFLGTAGTFRADSIAAGADPAVRNWGDYWLTGVTVPFTLSANSKLSAGLAYTEGRNNFIKAGTDPKEPNESAKGRLVLTIAYSLDL